MIDGHPGAGVTVLEEDFVFQTEENAEKYAIEMYGDDYGEVVRIESIIIRETMKIAAELATKDGYIAISNSDQEII